MQHAAISKYSQYPNGIIENLMANYMGDKMFI